MDIDTLPTQSQAVRIKKEKAWIYLCKTPQGHKIGKSIYLRDRMKMLQREHGNIDVLHYFEVDIREASDIEYACHQYFKDKQNNYRTEYFDLQDDDISEFSDPSFIYKMRKAVEQAKIEDVRLKIRKLIKQKRKIETIKQELTELERRFNDDKNAILDEIKRLNELYALIIDIKLS